MSYRVNRALGYESWGVYNPWVWANLAQPQRGRGYESPMVFKTHPPRLSSHYLGQVDSDAARGARMERYAVVGLGLSAVSLALVGYSAMRHRKVRANRRRRRAR